VPETEQETLELEKSEDTEILVFSDSHLTCHYDKQKAEYLKEIIEPADFVIINGDFWDGYMCDFDKFIEGDYQDVFEMLKERHAVYLYGNHDLKYFADDRVDKFSDYSADKLELTVGENVYYFEHGNKLMHSLEEKYPYILRNRMTLRIGKLFESLGVKLFGEKYLDTAYSFQNEQIKKISRETMRENEMLIAGHVHVPELDKDARYANDGLIRHGIASYILIENGDIKLVKDRY
jgi:predicted phosphodiesterase